MKQIFHLVLSFTIITVTQAQVVGVGTTSPDSAAILDIFSTNKGVLIPRVLDTSAVLKPLEGLIIYAKNTRAPYYYNGVQWLQLGGGLPTANGVPTGRITYQVSGAGFSSSEEDLTALSHGAANPAAVGPGGISTGSPSVSSFSITKTMDLNSKAFNMATLAGTVFASVEIKVYATGATTPYASYQLKNFVVEGYQVSVSADGAELTESLSLSFENYGFKDWVRSTSFGYNLASKTFTSY
ncbi:MAG: hypothetical protein EON98_03100 [Chitinophagaceae bacterium]|nr:MAG: hypothetical protein EON98_03100 [Chitinophagaceae bacterium]